MYTCVWHVQDFCIHNKYASIDFLSQSEFKNLLIHMRRSAANVILEQMFTQETGSCLFSNIFHVAPPTETGDAAADVSIMLYILDFAWMRNELFVLVSIVAHISSYCHSADICHLISGYGYIPE